MNRSAPFTKFVPITVVVYLAALLVIALGAPFISAYISQRSATYVAAAGESTDTAKQIGYYRLALALEPKNASYRQALADLYLKQNNTQAAIDVLGNTVGERLRKASLLLNVGRYGQALQTIGSLDSAEATILRSKAAIEQGRESMAYKLVLDARNDAERLQLGLCYAVAVNPEAVQRVAKLMSSEAGRKRLERASGGGVALAQELYNEKLYRASERILAEAGESSEKYVLLTHVQLEKPPKEGEKPRHRLETARDTALRGSTSHPANLKLHELLQQIYTELGDSGDTAQEEQIIQKLRSGKL